MKKWCQLTGSLKSIRCLTDTSTFFWYGLLINYHFRKSTNLTTSFAWHLQIYLPSFEDSPFPPRDCSFFFSVTFVKCAAEGWGECLDRSTSCRTSSGSAATTDMSNYRKQKRWPTSAGRKVLLTITTMLRWLLDCAHTVNDEVPNCGWGSLICAMLS